MTARKPDTDQLIEQASHGDRDAREQLLGRHRGRLRKMIALRLDRRMAARVDPSDVVQEVLAEAAQKLSGYLRDRPLPFYPWLRQIAWDRLVQVHRQHIQAQKRSVVREEPGVLHLSDESAAELASRLVDLASSPSAHALRQELRDRVQTALGQLRPRDHEVLVLRHLEQLSTAETAAVLGIAEGAVKTRHLRALQRLRDLLGEEMGEGEP
jgi:RNA polymerase sigma-70 factor (ECF subfamily)